MSNYKCELTELSIKTMEEFIESVLSTVQDASAKIIDIKIVDDIVSAEVIK